ncbi:hypothetical protein CDAR_601141 [Caerostris darwini]|uniref:Uncharacterized protein n=1 Tax=Caerostris darwini TaxID=1538125 RepID=A0AAV4T3M5_9ARAC|nr:hypothetical protein CDAR_601141 [Caerostris darwini]
MSEGDFLYVVYTGHILKSSNSLPCGEEILVSWPIGCCVTDGELLLWAINLEAFYNLAPLHFHLCNFLHLKILVASFIPLAFFWGGDIHNYFVCVPHHQPSALQHFSKACRKTDPNTVANARHVVCNRTLYVTALWQLVSIRDSQSENLPTPQTMWAEKRRGGGTLSVDAAVALFPGVRRFRRRDVPGLLQWQGRIVVERGLDQTQDVPSFCARLSPKTIVCRFLLFLRIVRIPKVYHSVKFFF